MQTKFRISCNTISFLIILLIVLNIFVFPKTVKAEENQLFIQIVDSNDQPIDEIEENNYFKIWVYDISLPIKDAFVSDVFIEFNNKTYLLIEGEKILSSPTVDQDTEFLINATKEGYISGQSAIIVRNIDEAVPKLLLTPSEFVVDADAKFSVTVTDNSIEKNPVEGARVYIQSVNNEDEYTDEYGVVILEAPNDREEITIYATLDGFEKGNVRVSVEIDKPLWLKIIEHRFFPLFVAFLALFSAVIFVQLRQRKSVYSRAKEITDENVVEKYAGKKEYPSNKYNAQQHTSEMVRVKTDNDSKVEEIRITRHQKEKEVVPVKTEEDTPGKVIKDKINQRNEDEWFEGTDDIKYEIDKLTGKIDEEGLDKWFEGVDGLKEKINEKMKKKNKDKKEEDS